MFVIAKNTLKEFIRNKIVYIILGLSVGLIFLTFFISRLALSEASKIVLDFSLTIIEIFGLILTLFLGSTLLYNEISKNTILLILSKNPSRGSFLVGKFLGFALIVLLIYLLLSLAFLGVLLIHHIPLDIMYFVAIFLSFIKMLVVLAFIVFFSTFISPLLTLLVSLAVYIIAHTMVFVKFYLVYANKLSIQSPLSKIVDFVYYLFPNFADLSMKDHLLSPNLGVYSIAHVSVSAIANLLYIGILLFLGIMIFKKREF